MKKVIIIAMLLVFLKLILELNTCCVFNGNWFSVYFFSNVHDEILYGDTIIFYTFTGQVQYKDNDQPVSSGYVKALRYDWERDQIITVDSSSISNDGSYSLSKCPLDTLDIAAYADDELDFVPGFHDTTINWLNAITTYQVSNFYTVNIKVNRIIKQGNAINRICGRILKDPHNQTEALKDAIIYARIGSKFKRYSISDENGFYQVDSLPTGNFEIIVCRMGYYSDYRIIQVGQYNTDSVNFYLARVAGMNPPVEFIPEKFSLYQNYPNPFNPVTKIRFDISAPLNPSEGGKFGFVTLIIYDVLGREVSMLVNQHLKPGTYEVEWDGANYPSGLYFYKLITDNYIGTKKMVLIK